MTRLSDEQLAKLPPVQRRAASSGRNLNDRSDGIQERLKQRHQRESGKIVQNLLDMASPGRALPVLTREEPKGGIPSRRGSAEKNYQPGQGNETAGIASPLIEGASAPEGQPASTPTLAREYWPEGLESSDGLFVMPAIKSLTMRDANGEEVVVQLADPSAAPEVAP